MEHWTVYQYRSVFDDFYNTCDEATKAAIDNRFAQLVEKGNMAREPISKHLDDGIFELRAKTARCLYYFEPGRRIVIVVAFLKDQRQVNPNQLRQAKKIRKILRDEQETLYGIQTTH
jgi:hypothetical protein